jgi:hypothetical protein
MSGNTAFSIQLPGSSIELRFTRVFQRFPWLNGITLTNGLMEEHLSKLSGIDAIDQKDYSMLKVCELFIMIFQI